MSPDESQISRFSTFTPKVRTSSIRGHRSRDNYGLLRLNITTGDGRVTLGACLGRLKNIKPTGHINTKSGSMNTCWIFRRLANHLVPRYVGFGTVSQASWRVFCYLQHLAACITDYEDVWRRICQSLERSRYLRLFGKEFQSQCVPARNSVGCIETLHSNKDRPSQNVQIRPPQWGGMSRWFREFYCQTAIDGRFLYKQRISTHNLEKMYGAIEISFFVRIAIIFRYFIVSYISS